MTQDDTFVVSSSTALNMGEHLLALLNTVIQNLPEQELRKMREALYQSVSFTDDLLYNISISSTFDMLTVSDVSATHDVNGSVRTSASHRTYGKVTAMTPTKTTAPPPSPASTVDTEVLVLRSPFFVSGENGPPAVAHNQPAVPGSAVMEHKKPADVKSGTGGMIVSTRPRVGQPDYTLHPAFVESGIPGPYLRPPVDLTKPDPAAYYVITKGLYVGIFSSWGECAPWVVKVAGSVYCKVRQWAEAQTLYNARLVAGACEVLS